MNNARRKKIDAVMDRIEAMKDEVARLIEEAEEIAEDLEGIRDDEQEYYDNMPEALQGGEKGYAAEAAVSQMEEALNAIRYLADLDFNGDDIITALDEAKQ